MQTRLVVVACSAVFPIAAASLYACGSDTGGLVEEGPPDVTAGDAFNPGRDDGSTGSDSSSGGDAGRDGSGDGRAEGGEGGGGDGGLPLVKINEVFVDKNLAGDATEWVELWAPVGTPLAGLRLRLIYPGDAGVKYELDVSIDGGAFATNYWVVGGLNAAGGGVPDQTYTITTWGLSDVGAIQLVKFENGTRTLLDVVGYGGTGATAVPPLGQQPNATSEGQIFIYDNNNNRSFSRKVGDGGVPIDTDDNANDFCNTQRSFRGASNQCQ